MLLRIVRGLAWIIVNLAAKVEVAGLENIPLTGGVIVAGNHLGRLDAMLVYSVVQRHDIILIAAEKYYSNPFWRAIGNALNVIWVDRFNADLRAVRGVLDRLKKGQFFGVAPEGTRSKTEKLQPAKPGTSYIAAKAGVPIVPAAVIGSEDRIVSANLRRLRRTPVKVIIGKPFTLPPVPPKNREETLEQYTEEIMCQIAALLPEKYHGHYAGHPRLQELQTQQGMTG